MISRSHIMLHVKILTSRRKLQREALVTEREKEDKLD